MSFFTLILIHFSEKIKVGLRVVRPPSSESENDNKFENSKAIGTIVHLTESGMVKVQWDTGGNDEFTKGDNNQFDLLLYDNAQIGMKIIFHVYDYNYCIQFLLIFELITICFVTLVNG